MTIAPLRHPQWADRPPTDDTFQITDGVRPDGTSLVRQRTPAAIVDETGALPPGALCLAADHALGAAIADRLADERSLVTSTIQINLVHPLARDSGVVEATGTALGVSEWGGFATATMTAEHGGFRATVMGRFALVDLATVARHTPPPIASSPTSTPAGQRRRPHPLTDPAPVHHFLGTDVVEAGDGTVRLTIESRPGLANLRGGLHGGVSGLLGERANDLALRTAVPPDRMRVVELRVAYLRPVPLLGSPVALNAEIVHRGRSVAAVRSEILDHEGRRAVVIDTVHATPVAAP